MRPLNLLKHGADFEDFSVGAGFEIQQQFIQWGKVTVSTIKEGANSNQAPRF